MPDLWGLASIATTFAFYTGVFISVGTVLTATVFQITIRRRAVIFFAGLGLAATCLGFALMGATLTGDVAGMTDPEMLGFLWSTPVGTTVALRLIGLTVLIAGLFLGRVGVPISLAGGSLTLWSFATVGHVPDRDSLMLNAVLVFHLVAVALWIGVLSPLRRAALQGATLQDAADLGHRFGTLASVFVPLLILAGGYMSYELVGSLRALIGSSYGQVLIVKVFCVAVLLVAAAANKLRFVPRLAAGDRRAADHLAKSIAIEWAIVVAILAATAVLTSALPLPN